MRRWVSLIATAMAAACGLTVEGSAEQSAAPATDPSNTRPVDGGSGPGDGSPPVGEAPGDGSAPEDSSVVVDAGVDAEAPKAGQALRFTNNAYVDVGALAIPANFTMEAWVNPASYPSAAAERYILAKDRVSQGQGQARLGIDGTGKLFFILSDSSGSDHGLFAGAYVLLSPGALPLNTWSHVAVTKSGAAFALLVNGATVKTANASASFVYGGPATPFRIAARVGTGDSANGTFSGTIDEVRLWSVARTSAEIAATMKTPVAPATPGLAASFRFEEGVGTTTSNAKGTPSGLLVNGPTWVASTAY